MPPATAAWTGGVEGGSVVRDGETATRIRIRASLDERPLSHYLYAEWYRTDSNSIELGYRPRYWFASQLYTFGEGRVRFETSPGIERETLLLGGLGLQLVASDTQQAWLEAGAGYRLISFTDDTGLEDRDEEVGILRAGGSQILSETFRLELDADLFTSTSLLQSQLEIGVSMRVPQGAIKLSYQIRRIDIDGLDTVDDSSTAVAFTVGF
ncbi:MAG: DUF481 domain-containing protein [Granulosicoccus sp.]|nr:DUF481 domain-containing protein [Granulosicoccus sp.]